MTTTDKAFCRELSRLLVSHGVRNVVLCPGSRNAPLIVGLSRMPGLKAISVIDERSAAFIALGMSIESGIPTAIVCTSGSALLNTAPAVAESYYRQVPLIVISADRPLEWIDQDDSQTIRQAGALNNIVKGHWDIPVETGDASQMWYVNRILNDAMIESSTLPKGPVHINVRLDNPLGNVVLIAPETTRKISVIGTDQTLSGETLESLANQASKCRKLLIIAGFMPPSSSMDRLLHKMSQRPNVAIMHEAQANIHDVPMSIANIDSVLSSLTSQEKRDLLPELVITIGGSLVSRFVKKWLREGSRKNTDGNTYGMGGLRHWHVGMQPHSVDCFMSLETRICMEADAFFSQLESAMPPSIESDYSKKWVEACVASQEKNVSYGEECPWSDYAAMEWLMAFLPSDWNLHLSNGTAVRYAQLFGYSHIKRIECNRGVSGIDGCLSTALGASLEYDGVTMIIAGDMSAQYDMAAFSANCVPSRFKIAVLNNGGGGIFRFIESTKKLNELERFFCCDTRLPLQDLAHGFGFAYFEASDMEGLMKVWSEFAQEDRRPAILNILTPAQTSAQVLSGYFKSRE